jgi:hypothetical protein
VHRLASRDATRLHPVLHLLNKESAMKTLMLAALIGLAASSSAFAQTNTGANDPHAASSDSSFTTAAATPDQAGQWVAPYGQPVAGRTRAQVYQRLVTAEQDGQLAYLDRTVYAHH